MLKAPVIPADIRTHDNTMFQWWNDCPRKYYFCSQLGLRKKTKAPALSWGGLMHDGLAEWYKTRDPDKTLEVIDKHPDWQDEPDALDEEGVFLDEAPDFRTKARALQKMTEYMLFWKDDPGWEILLTETPFELTEPDGFRYGGKIDLIVEWNGKPWVVDHKTTTRFGSTQAQRNRFYQQFEQSPQMGGYTWAGSLLHGKPLAGVIINVICIHKNPKPPEIQMNRRAIVFDEAKVAEWKQMRIEEYREISQALEEDNFRPRWDNCVGKYGPCPFYNVCSLPEASRKRVLDLDFEVHPWNWMEEES